MSYQRKFQEDMQRATGRFQDLVQENKVIITFKFWVFTFLERHVLNTILEFTNTGTSKDTENITSTSARRRFRTQN